MSSNPNQSDQLFDEFANTYDATLRQSLSPTGESKDYYAHGRLDFLKSMLEKMSYPVQSIVDYGCGNGSTMPFFHESLHPAKFLGVDVSEKSIETATQQFGSDTVHFKIIDENIPSGEFDLGFVNGVFHHIPIAGRLGAAKWIYSALKPGALLAFWENNPWNPGTKWLMYRCCFDDDAIPLSPIQSRRLLRSAGFEIVRTDFLFIFPRSLSWLRGLERPVSRLPLGGQYQVLCRKPI